MQYFRFHFYDGKAPVQVLANSREAAEAFVRARFGSNFTPADNGLTPIDGYNNLSADTGQPVQGGTGGGSTEVQELFPEEAYQAGLRGAGLNPEGAFGGILRNRYDDVFSNFWANKALAEGRGEDSTGMGDFQQYAGRNAGGQGGNIYNSARDYFRQIAGGGNLGALGTGNEAIRNVRVRSEDDPEAPGSAEARGRLGTLARTAAFGQYGGGGSTPLPPPQKRQDEV